MSYCFAVHQENQTLLVLLLMIILQKSRKGIILPFQNQCNNGNI